AFSRITACWLVALVLLPFTAPFRTCDLAAFLSRRVRHVPITRSTATALATDSSVANVPAISRMGRTRLLDVAGVKLPDGDSVRVMTIVTRSGGVPRALHERAVLSTILRV